LPDSANLYIADVPTPVALPFAYFPLTMGRSAGVMMPTFGSDPDRGYFCKNGGYYIPVNDYVDLYAHRGFIHKRELWS